jgi:D-alanyl-D-alanine carboxypeptidase
MKLSASFSPRVIATAGAVLCAAATPVLANERYAAIVIDTKTKEILHADQAEEIRFPASLTKMMTLYIVFEELERGRLRVSDRVVASRRAAKMPPSRLGLKQGQSLSIDDAIQALVTRSANDVATAIAEKIDGTESRFAQRMTSRARALGMTSTRFANASGLPDEGMYTTAHDMARLSQALMRDFPQYYDYFQTRDFWWGNRYSGNHNRLLGNVQGVDGIKTGYTRASGFNLASSVVRDGRRLIAVVMGGYSAAERDAQVTHLIETAYMDLDGRANGQPPMASATYTLAPVINIRITGEGDESSEADDAEYSDTVTPPPVIYTLPSPPHAVRPSSIPQPQVQPNYGQSEGMGAVLERSANGG